MAEVSTKLQVTLPSDREIVMTRMFNAPRELVFEAHSKCEHVSKWWGRRGSTMPVCEMDFTPGGKWRFVERHADGEHGFRGEFREIIRPERIVQTFEYEGAPGQISVDTMTLTERGGATLVTVTSVFDSKEARDAMVQSGMEEGAGETWDRLDEYLRSLK